METQRIHTAFRRGLTLLLFTALFLTLFSASAWAKGITDFLDCSSGSATGYFIYSDHFYKIEWTGINSSETQSVRLDYSSSFNRLEAYTNGDTTSTLHRKTTRDAVYSNHQARVVLAMHQSRTRSSPLACVALYSCGSHTLCRRIAHSPAPEHRRHSSIRR